MTLLETYVFAVLNFIILAVAVAAAVWVWRDGSKRRDPWAATWGMVTLFMPLALPAYLLKIRTRKPSPH